MIVTIEMYTVFFFVLKPQLLHNAERKYWILMFVPRKYK